MKSRVLTRLFRERARGEAVLTDAKFRSLLKDYSVIPVVTSQLGAKEVFKEVVEGSKFNFKTFTHALFIIFSNSIKDSDPTAKIEFINRWFSKQHPK